MIVKSVSKETGSDIMVVCDSFVDCPIGRIVDDLLTPFILDYYKVRESVRESAIKRDQDIEFCERVLAGSGPTQDIELCKHLLEGSGPASP